MIIPLVHYVGGKRQLLPELKKYMPKEYNNYYEIFLGGGALLFDLKPKKAFVNDLNKELINLYMTVKNYPNELIHELGQGYFNTEKDYYRIREWDRSDKWPIHFQPWEIAARTLYLNRNCFNGLYRVNSKNQFNVPYGKHKNEFSFDMTIITDVSKYFNDNDINITNADFEIAVKDAKEGDFIYQDPPYDPVSNTSDFTSYTKEGFTKNDQIRLRNCFKELTDRGCYCMASNAGTDFIKELYKEFHIVDVEATRVLNCKGDKRGKVSEVLIMNYNNQIRD
jgi:DNA adenine methylase